MSRWVTLLLSLGILAVSPRSTQNLYFTNMADASRDVEMRGRARSQVLVNEDVIVTGYAW